MDIVEMKGWGCNYGICTVVFLFIEYHVSPCPSNRANWIKRSLRLNCTGRLSYHCGFTDHGTLGEFCLRPRKVPSKNCPKFDFNSTSILGLWNCTYDMPIITEKCTAQNLPQNGVLSDELYKYPECFLGQELQYTSTEDLPTKLQSNSLSYDDITLTAPSINGNTSIYGYLDTTGPSNKTMKNNDGNKSQMLQTITIAIISAIVAITVIVLTMNIVVFWFINHRKKQNNISAVPNTDNISDTEIANEAQIQDDAYECIEEQAIKHHVTVKKENSNVDEVDTPYDHLLSNRVIVMDRVNQACSSL